MMIQILVYAYLHNIYYSSRIEEFCRNDIRFMWFSANVTHDHNAINRFRYSRLKDVEAVFGNLKNNKHLKRLQLRGLRRLKLSSDC